MDINSLLSPSDSPVQTPPPQPAHASPSMLAAHSPGKRAVRQQMPSRTPSGLSQQITSSPQLHLTHQQLPSPGYGHLANGARAVHSAASTPQPLGSPHDARMTPPSRLYRQASTPGMDALAGGSHQARDFWQRDPRSVVVSAETAMATTRIQDPSPRRQHHTADWYADLASMQQQQQAARQSSLGHQRPVT
jgi:hypothetical protein